MTDGPPTQCQLHLFPKQLDWEEFPIDVRQQLSQLLAVMCIDIVQDSVIESEELYDEPGSNSTMAS